MSQDMWQMAALLLILSLTVHIVKSDTHVIVTPTSDPSICRDHADATVVCYTLSNLISSKPAFLRDSSDLELEFLTGTHTISNKELELKDKKNVTWHGQDAVIVCEKNLRFTFSKIERLVIKNLKFTRCGKMKYAESLCSYSVKKKLAITAALYLEQISTLHFVAVTVVNSTGYGLFGLNLQKEASFAFCQFLDNNRACSTNNKKCPCNGGNIALWSSNISNSLHISFSSTVIKGGINRGVRLSSKNIFYFFRANGLTVVYCHSEYQVQLSINNCSFMKNTGNSKHAAVLVYDDTGLKNQLTIINSTFKEEGRLVIYNFNRYNCFAAPNGTPKSSYLARIINCSFLSGIESGLEIHVSPTYVRKKQCGVITIKGSQFRNFKGLPGQAIVKVEFTYNHFKFKYPAVLVKVQECIFEFNKVLPIFVHLEKDAYLDSANAYNHSSSKTPIVTLTHTSFTNNEYSAVLITVKKISIPIWKSIIENNQIISIVDIINCCFTNNTAKKNEGVLTVRQAYIGLKNITFSLSSGTALYAEKSVIRIEDQNLFKENCGIFGGAMNLYKSMLFLMPLSHINIINNTASNQGGGIFAITQHGNEKSCKQNQNEMNSRICTISKYKEATGTELITLTGNIANFAGSSLFGGKYSNCISLYKNTENCTFTPEKNNQPIPPFVKYGSNISSPATRLCLCDNNSVPTDQCSSISREVFPGQTFQIPIVAMGELRDKTAAVVTAKIRKEGTLERRFVGIGYGQQIQLLENNSCTNICYQVNSDSKQETLYLDIDEGGFPPKVLGSDPNVIQPFLINVTFKDCPKGFNLSRKTEGAPECKCEDILNNNSNIKCDIIKGITIKGNMWIGLISTSHINKIVIYENCPFDYCNCSSENCLKSIGLENPEKQCNYNRNGTLCGACRNGYSNVLGSSNCDKECSNVYLVLIIPFALAGVALVVLLLKCNLTVSVGHINGIIFYANIVQVNKAILFPNHKVPYQIFSTFIAWLNLDLGIETCFFENMDSYAKVWLQFVFPVYVWIIIALIIVLANYSPKLGTLIGNNAVPVLATLFFLSYAKLLRTIIAATAFTFIEFEDDSYITVWLRDGNVKYFDPKHIVLFLVALLFTFLYILPLTLLVLLAPCLQARSHHKAFRWVNRLKPFLDAYQGPYSDKFRFWTGLLLILRIVLLIIDASNYGNDPSMSFFCTIGVIIPLAMVLVKTHVYRHTLANCIELLSLLNLMILFAVSWLTTTTEYPKWHPIREYATYISVAVTMLAFIGIILYQLIVAIYPTLIMVVYPKVFNRRDKSTEQTTGETAHAVSVEPPTSTTVELQDCDQLREPLLETN